MRNKIKNYMFKGSVSALDRRRGFTLLEILLAIVIMGIVLATVYGAYTATFRIVGDTDYADEIYGMARTAFEQITRDLESACSFEGAFTFVSEEQDMGEHLFMSLRFISSRHLGFHGKDGGIAEISYYTVNEDDQGYLLVRKDELLQRKEAQEEEYGEEFLSSEGGYGICTNIKEVKWFFWDVRGEKYEKWDSQSGASEQKGRIPSVAGVQIDFENPSNPENPYRFETKIFIPASESQK
ncbi:MAG: type II secretion system GspH family protein [Syntrophales bacterium]|nr:type II secretion system GspH family protein [Syntrophales bacterium]MDY0044341.1 type II secretion system protein [Syntrophales bacterium]